MKDKPPTSAEQAWDPQRLLNQVVNGPFWTPKGPAEWRLPRGKHEGCSLAWALVAKPDYVAWILNLPAPSGWMGEARRNLEYLIQQLDTMPITVRCGVPFEGLTQDGGCGRLATRLSYYRGSRDRPYAWCDGCSPWNSGAMPNRLIVVQHFDDILINLNELHVHPDSMYSTSYRRPSQKALERTMQRTVRYLAEAKGLGPRLNEAEAARFFTSTPVTCELD